MKPLQNLTYDITRNGFVGQEGVDLINALIDHIEVLEEKVERLERPSCKLEVEHGGGSGYSNRDAGGGCGGVPTRSRSSAL
jgi:hypothetical protein